MVKEVIRYEHRNKLRMNLISNKIIWVVTASGFLSRINLKSALTHKRQTLFFTIPLISSLATNMWLPSINLQDQYIHNSVFFVFINFVIEYYLEFWIFIFNCYKSNKASKYKKICKGFFILIFLILLTYWNIFFRLYLPPSA